MTRYWGLVACSVLLALVLVASQALLPLHVQPGTAWFLVLNAKILAFVGAIAATIHFSPGDYLRKAWIATAANAFLLIESDLWMRIIGPSIHPDTIQAGRGVILGLANLAMPIGVLLFGHALKVAHLDIFGTRRGRVLSMLAAAAVALALVGGAAWQDFRGLFAIGVPFDIAASGRLASDLGDIFSFILLAPLLYTVLVLRGGSLRWPFLFMALSVLCWLCYDLVVLLMRAAGESGSMFTLQQACRVLACMFVFSAGMAQRWAVGAVAKQAEPRAQAA